MPTSLPRVDSPVTALVRSPSQRRCSKPTCARGAAATMSYDYARRTVFLGSLVDNRTPATYDLCAEHAQALSLPRGWTIRRDRLASVDLRAS